MAGIGDIGVKVTADTTEFADGMNRTQQIAATSMARVEQANRIAQAASDKFVKSLQYQVDTFGKSEAEIALYKANLLGASDAAKPLITQLEAMSVAAGGHAGSLRGATGETEKFSLASAGARRELIVLAHELSQGNFSRFGGSMMVLAERTNFTAILFNPLTVAIAAAGAAMAALGYEIYQGKKAWDDIGDSMKLTMGYTGLTQQQIYGLSASIADGSKEIIEGRDAITQLAASGRVMGDQLASFGRVALDMSKDTGKSIEDVVSSLAKLSGNAKSWAEEYQKQHHVFTAADIELIDSLDKQGKQAQATAAVIAALENAHKRLKTAMDDSAKSSSGWSAWWADWADGASRIKEALMSIGAEKTDFAKINSLLADRAKLEDDLRRAQARGLAADVAAIEAQLDLNKREINSIRDKATAHQQAAKALADAGKGGDSQIIANKYLDGGTKSDEQKRKDAVDKENKEFQEAIANLQKNSATYEAVVKHHRENLAQIDAQYAKKHPVQDDAAVKFLQTLRDQDAAIQAQLQVTNSLTESQKEQAKFEQQMLDFKGKKLTAEQASLIANQASIRAQLAKNVADAEELRIKNEVQKLAERARQIDEQMSSSEAGRKEQYQRQLGAFGQGADAQQRVLAVQAIYKEYQKYRDELAKVVPADGMGWQQYLVDVEKIHNGLEKSLADFDAYYAELKKKQGDWSNGAESAFQNYMSSAENVSAQVETAFSNAFKGMEDVFVNFATTGKLSFASLTTSILADIARIQSRQAIAGLLNANIDWGSFGTMFGPGVIGSGLSGARAAGGPVSSGASYLVGENGPEVFSPSGSGTIIPNHALGGGGAQINLVTNVSSSGSTSSASGGSGSARAVGDALNAKMKAVIVQEMRQGGIIWNYQNRGIAP